MIKKYNKNIKIALKKSKIKEFIRKILTKNIIEEKKSKFNSIR